MTTSPPVCHAHVYYDVGNLHVAGNLCRRTAEKFKLAMGRLHSVPIGPHPLPSCQLTIPLDQLEAVLPWLDRNRQNLSVLVHPVTGNDLADHTDDCFWLGTPHRLRLDTFKK